MNFNIKSAMYLSIEIEIVILCTIEAALVGFLPTHTVSRFGLLHYFRNVDEFKYINYRCRLACHNQYTNQS